MIEIREMNRNNIIYKGHGLSIMRLSESQL